MVELGSRTQPGGALGDTYQNQVVVRVDADGLYGFAPDDALAVRRVGTSGFLQTLVDLKAGQQILVSDDGTRQDVVYLVLEDHTPFDADKVREMSSRRGNWMNFSGNPGQTSTLGLDGTPGRWFTGQFGLTIFTISRGDLRVTAPASWTLLDVTDGYKVVTEMTIGVDDMLLVTQTGNDNEFTLRRVGSTGTADAGLLPQGDVTLGVLTPTPTTVQTAPGANSLAFQSMNLNGITITPLADIQLGSITLELLDNTAPGTPSALRILQGNGVGSPLFATSTDTPTVPFSTSVTAPVTWTGFAGVTLLAGVTYTVVCASTPNNMFFRFFNGPGHPVFGVSQPAGGGTRQSAAIMTGTVDVLSPVTPDLNDPQFQVVNHLYSIAAAGSGAEIGVTGGLQADDAVFWDGTAWKRLSPELVPAPISTGSNTNGTWIDIGDQRICRGTHNGGSGFVGFPAVFADTSYTVTFGVNDDAPNGVVVSTASKSTAEFECAVRYLVGSTWTPALEPFDWIAIGAKP